MAIHDDSRSAWGATTATWNYYVAPSKRARRVWHWPGGPTGLTNKPHDSCLTLVKGWQNYHKSKGWGDIGYNYLICPHDRAIEGRGRDFVGTHCPGWNTEGWGIQFMLGQGETVTDGMFSRGIQLAQELEKVAGHDLYDNGHRENYSTSCPGDQVQAWVNKGGPESVTDLPKPDIIPGLNIAKLTVDGIIGGYTLRAMRMLMRKRGHDIPSQSGAAWSQVDDALTRAIQTELNDHGVLCDHKKKLVVDGKGIEHNRDGRWPPVGTTHTLEACHNAKKTSGSGWIASPAVLVKKWQSDINYTTSSYDSFLW